MPLDHGISPLRINGLVLLNADFLNVTLQVRRDSSISRPQIDDGAKLPITESHGSPALTSTAIILARHSLRLAVPD